MMIGGCPINGVTNGSPQPQASMATAQQQMGFLLQQHQQSLLCTTITSIAGASSDDLINGISSNQLIRSKSLNDISNDSQILAFTSDRSINNSQINNPITNLDAASQHLYNNNHQQHHHQQHQNQVINYGNLGHSNLNSSYHEQQQHNNHGTTTSHVYNSTNRFNDQPNPDTFFRSPFNDNNSCSNKQQQQPIVNHTNAINSTTTTPNIFSVCNPIVMNLNGVTDQIGNLHL